MERYCNTCPVNNNFCFVIEVNKVAAKKSLGPTEKHIKIAELREKTRNNGNGCRNLNKAEPNYTGRDSL